MRARLDKRELLKNLVWMLILAVGITLYYWRLYKALMVGDALFLSGVLALCAGLYRVVCRLGFFDGAVYGTKKLFRQTKESYYDYVNSHPYTKRYQELLLLSAVFMLVSFLFEL